MELETYKKLKEDSANAIKSAENVIEINKVLLKYADENIKKIHSTITVKNSKQLKVE